jgi:hypothetical protein
MERERQAGRGSESYGAWGGVRRGGEEGKRKGWEGGGIGEEEEKKETMCKHVEEERW